MTADAKTSPPIVRPAACLMPGMVQPMVSSSDSNSPPATVVPRSCWFAPPLALLRAARGVWVPISASLCPARAPSRSDTILARATGPAWARAAGDPGSFLQQPPFRRQARSVAAEHIR